MKTNQEIEEHVEGEIVEKKKRKRQHEEISKRVKELINDANNLCKIEKIFMSLPKTHDGYKFSNDEVIYKSDLKGIRSAYILKLKEFGFYASDLVRKKKSTKKSNKPGVGLLQPLVLKVDTMNFIKNGNFGFYVAGDKSSGSLISKVPLIDEGITNRIQLSSIIKTYCYVNGLVSSEKGGFMKADKTMMKYLGTGFSQLKKNKPEFSAEKFGWTDLNSLVTYLTDPYRNLSEEERTDFLEIYNPVEDNATGSTIGLKIKDSGQQIRSNNAYYKELLENRND